MMIIAKAMIRNKPDSYCLSYDLRTTGISAMVHDLLSLYIAVRHRPVGAHRVLERGLQRAEEVGRDAPRVRQAVQEVSRSQRPTATRAFAQALSSGFASARIETITPADRREP